MITLRKNTVCETIKINKRTFRTEIDINTAAKAFSDCFEALDTLSGIAEGEDKDSAVGVVFCQLIYDVFGDNAKPLLEHFGANHGEAGAALLPFMLNKLLPAVVRERKRREKSALGKYSLGKAVK